MREKQREIKYKTTYDNIKKNMKIIGTIYDKT